MPPRDPEEPAGFTGVPPDGAMAEDRNLPNPAYLMVGADPAGHWIDTRSKPEPRPKSQPTDLPFG